MFALDSITRVLSGRVVPTVGSKMRWLLPAAAGLVLVVGYLAVAALIALVLVTAEGNRFSLGAALVAALPGWLAAYQVPVSIAGAELAVLPLLPTALMLLLIAIASSRVARHAGLRRPDQARPVILTMAGSQALFGGLVALVLGGTVEASVLAAVLCCGGLAGAASVAGLAKPCGLIDLARSWIDPGARSALRVGLVALAAIAAAGALVTLAGMCFTFPGIREVLARSGSAGDAFGLTLLSILYLPNAVLAGWSFAVGTGVSVGDLTVQPWHVAAGPVPEVPLLAVLPSSGPAFWWPVVFVVPVFVGLVVGKACGRRSSSLLRGFGMLGIGALVAALGTLALAGVTGGSLGGGVFDPVTLRPATQALATFWWIAIPAGMTVWVEGGRDAETDRETGGEIGGDDGAGDEIDEHTEDSEVPDTDEPDTGSDVDDVEVSEETEALVAELEQIDLSDLDADDPTDSR